MSRAGADILWKGNQDTNESIIFLIRFTRKEAYTWRLRSAVKRHSIAPPSREAWPGDHVILIVLRRLEFVILWNIVKLQSQIQSEYEDENRYGYHLITFLLK